MFTVLTPQELNTLWKKFARATIETGKMSLKAGTHDEQRLYYDLSTDMWMLFQETKILTTGEAA
jgi:hypothetical protein